MILFLFLMVICGCSGSTSGGMKTVRALVLAKNTLNEFRRLVNPQAIIPIRLNGKALSFNIVQRLLAFSFLYIFIIFFSWGVFVIAGMPVIEACIKAGANRFRPVLMTALTTMLALAPMAFFPGSSSRFTSPIGLVVFGGLASATLITLVFIPVLYSLFHGKERRSE